MYESLKVGDTVAVRSLSSYKLGRVARLTKTKAVLENGDEFRLSDGQEVAADWRGKHMTTNPQIVAEAKLRHDMSSVKTAIDCLDECAFRQDNINICQETIKKILGILENLKRDMNEKK